MRNCNVLASWSFSDTHPPRPRPTNTKSAPFVTSRITLVVILPQPQLNCKWAPNGQTVTRMMMMMKKIKEQSEHDSSSVLPLSYVTSKYTRSTASSVT